MRYPKDMTLEVTARCNFRCPYCYCVWHERPEFALPELGTEAWREVIDKCAADGCTDLLFTGGEPLMRPDIYPLLGYARRSMPSARLAIFTNGALMCEGTIKRLKRLKVRIVTSLQGLSTYREMTGTRRKPYRLLALMKRADELKWPMAVSIIVTKENMREAADIFTSAVLCGAQTIQMGPMMAEGRGRKATHLMLTREEWEAVKAKVRSLPDVNVPFSFVDEFICKCREQPDDFIAKWGDKNYSPCPAGKSFGVVGPNGQYRICLHAFDEQRKGNNE